MTKLTKRKLICVVIILAGLALDFISKRIIENNMELLESIPLWQDVFHITYVQNRGAAFGMMADNRWVFLSVSTVAIIAFCIYLARTRSDRPVWLYSLAMMTAGGIGNMIDRIWLGYVVDFLDFTLIDFAVFNIADSFICVGAAFMMLDLICDLVQTGKQIKKEAETPSEQCPEDAEECFASSICDCAAGDKSDDGTAADCAHNDDKSDDGASAKETEKENKNQSDEEKEEGQDDPDSRAC